MMAVKMTEQVRQHLKDVLEDDETETGGTAFEGETLEHFMREVYAGYDKVVTLKLVNKDLKACGIMPIKDGTDTQADEHGFEETARNKWSKYLGYLKKWAETHGFDSHFGESPLDYSGWCCDAV